MIEIWKSVVGYEEYFKVSDIGNVLSLRTNKLLKFHLGKMGYFHFSTKIGGRTGKSVCLKVHRLVAEAFLENIENKICVNHIDGNKLNNRVKNLEWVTHSENTKHAFNLGLLKVENGINNSLSKFDDSMLNFVLSNAKQLGGTMSQRKIAKELDVSHTGVYNIIKIYKQKL